MSQINDIAQKIYASEFYDDSSEDEGKHLISVISAWLETNIGQLNILIHSGYRVTENLDICPRMGPEEIAIFIQLYLKEYYKRKSQTALKTVTEVTPGDGETAVMMSEWTELREGDSQIKRQSLLSTPQQKIQAAQAFKSLSSEADIKIREFVQYYNLHKSLPRQVIEEGGDVNKKCFDKENGCEEKEPTCPTNTPEFTPIATQTKTNDPAFTSTQTKSSTNTTTKTLTSTHTSTKTLTSTPTLTHTWTYENFGECCEVGMISKAVTSQAEIQLEKENNSNSGTILDIHKNAIGANICFPRSSLDDSKNYTTQLRINGIDFLKIQGLGQLVDNRIYINQNFSQLSPHFLGSGSLFLKQDFQDACCLGHEKSVVLSGLLGGSGQFTGEDFNFSQNVEATTILNGWAICYSLESPEEVDSTGYFVEDLFSQAWHGKVKLEKKIKNNELVFVAPDGRLCYSVLLGAPDDLIPIQWNFAFEQPAPTSTSTYTITESNTTTQTYTPMCGYGSCALYRLCNEENYEELECVDKKTCPRPYSQIEKVHIAYKDEMPPPAIFVNRRCYRLDETAMNEPVSLCGGVSAESCSGDLTTFLDQKEYDSRFVLSVDEIPDQNIFEKCTDCCSCDCSTTCYSCDIDELTGLCEMYIPCYDTYTPTQTQT